MGLLLKNKIVTKTMIFHGKMHINEIIGFLWINNKCGSVEQFDNVERVCGVYKIHDPRRLLVTSPI